MCPLVPARRALFTAIGGCVSPRHATANLPTKILDFREFDLISRGGIPRPIGTFPEMLSQQILVGITFVGRLGVRATCETCI